MREEKEGKKIKFEPDKDEEKRDIFKVFYKSSSPRSPKSPYSDSRRRSSAASHWS